MWNINNRIVIKIFGPVGIRIFGTPWIANNRMWNINYRIVIKIFETSWFVNNGMWNINNRIVMKIFRFTLESEYLRLLGLSIMDCEI
jgi:hypothetical protein